MYLMPKLKHKYFNNYVLIKNVYYATLYNEVIIILFNCNKLYFI